MELLRFTLTGCEAPDALRPVAINILSLARPFGDESELRNELARMARYKWRAIWLRGAGRHVMSIVFSKASQPLMRDISKSWGEEATSSLRIAAFGLYCVDRAARHLRRGNIDKGLWFVENAKNAYRELLQVRIQMERAAKPRPDALQELIVEILRRNPHAKQPDVVAALKAQEHGEVIDSIIDDVIEWRDKNHPAESTPISALKDRISRARKKLSSR